jgi:hypothetical protein
MLPYSGANYMLFARVIGAMTCSLFHLEISKLYQGLPLVLCVIFSDHLKKAYEYVPGIAIGLP